MSWNALQFVRDYSIAFEQETEGWVNIQCPLCNGSSNHGGINLDGGYYHCWKCGGHSLKFILSKLLGISRDEADSIFQAYEATGAMVSRLNQKKKARQIIKDFQLPGEALGKFHRRYLERRGFDPDFIAKKYGVLGTGPASRWKGIDFQLRLIIPIWGATGELQSFQARDITGRSDARYKGCPQDMSPTPSKDTLYNAQNCKGKTVGVLEGVTDVWKLGDGFLATFGTALKTTQVKLLGEFDNLFFLFDSEPEAQKKAQRYAHALAAMGKSVEVIDLGLDGRDAGDLSESEVSEIRRELGFSKLS